ncbi:MAG: peptidase domain-containing ABC transporter, partial [Lachnospiraceae bacterium]|nr:peptidase domain-containing ABC transporter [Lachnospiraceae bacterium]
ISQFLEQRHGQIITFIPNQNFEKRNERKGSFRKFFLLIMAQKKMLVFIFIMSIFISAINVSGAMIFEYILSDSMGMTENVSGIPEVGYHYEEKMVLERTTDSIFAKLKVVFANINVVCGVIIIMYIMRWFMHIARGYLLALTAKRVDIPLTLGYYNHLVDLPASFHVTRKTGEFLSRFNDTSKIRDAISTAALTIMLDTIMALACGALLCCISTTLFLITLVIMLIYAFIMFLFREPIKLVNHEIMEQDAQVTSYLKESIDGIETVKAYQCEYVIKNKSEKLYERLADKSVKGSLIYNLQDSIISLAASVGVVVLLWVGTYLCINNIISIADLFVFYYLINYFLDPVSNLINLQPELQTAMVAAERLNDILDAEIEQQDSDKPQLESLYGDIKIENLDFRYGNRELVLQNVSMDFSKGKKIAIVGESGCGKTTLAKLLLSFYRPERGKVMIDGKNLSEYSIASVRKHIAYIPQDIFLFADTIYNNLKFGNEDVTDEEVKDACELCCADEFIEKLPMKYDTMVEENGNNLSGGQKQRLAIARALLKKPDILIMDEATSNLDTITEESIKRTIQNFSDTMTCIIIAHRINTIKNCDYIYVMDKGRIIEQGTHQSLLEEDGVYRKLVMCNR